jgi:nucleotide-binding universal stress UspA family protein
VVNPNSERRVLIVGADGSPDSSAAVAWAATEAQTTGAEIVAVHAVGLIEHQPGDPSAEHLRPDLAAWTSALDHLADARARRCREPGEPTDVLRRVATRVHADLIVVGTRGAGAHGATTIGSTSLGLAERSPCPVVIVPAPAPAAAPMGAR